MKKDNKIFWLAGITLLVLVMLPYLGLTQKFAISSSDFISDGQVNLLSYSIINRTVTFSFIQDVNYTMNDLAIFYTLGNNTLTYTSIPNPEGTNTINKYQIVIQDDNVTAILNKWHTIYTKETITQNVTVTNIVYQNVTQYVNQTINQTITVTKEVPVELTFLQKYGVAGGIFIIMGLIIIYLIYKRTR